MTFYCLFHGHRFETHLIRCNGSHFICRHCGKQIWRPVCPNEGDTIREFKEAQIDVRIESPAVRLARILLENIDYINIDKDGVVSPKWEHPVVQERMRQQLAVLDKFKVPCEVSL